MIIPFIHNLKASTVAWTVRLRDSTISTHNNDIRRIYLSISIYIYIFNRNRKMQMEQMDIETTFAFHGDKSNLIKGLARWIFYEQRCFSLRTRFVFYPTTGVFFGTETKMFSLEKHGKTGNKLRWVVVKSTFDRATDIAGWITKFSRKMLSEWLDAWTNAWTTVWPMYCGAVSKIGKFGGYKCNSLSCRCWNLRYLVAGTFLYVSSIHTTGWQIDN